MILYNKQLKTLEDVPYIETEEGILYTKFLSNDTLKEHGYLPVKDSEVPENDNQFKKIETTYSEKKDSYVVTHTIVNKTLEEIIPIVKETIQRILDSKARFNGYDDILSACSYAGYPNEYEEEGKAFGVWRAKTWKWCFDSFKEIKEGTKELPTSIDEFLKDMPKLELKEK